MSPGFLHCDDRVKYSSKCFKLFLLLSTPSRLVVVVVIVVVVIVVVVFDRLICSIIYVVPFTQQLLFQNSITRRWLVTFSRNRTNVDNSFETFRWVDVDGFGHFSIVQVNGISSPAFVLVSLSLGSAQVSLLLFVAVVVVVDDDVVVASTTKKQLPLKWFLYCYVNRKPK